MAYTQVISSGTTGHACSTVCWPVVTRHFKDPYKPTGTENDAAIQAVSSTSAVGTLILAQQTQTLYTRMRAIAAARQYHTWAPYSFASSPGPIEDSSGEHPPICDARPGQSIFINDTYALGTLDNDYWLLHDSRTDTSASIINFTFSGETITLPTPDGGTPITHAGKTVANVGTLYVYSNGDWRFYPSVYHPGTWSFSATINRSAANYTRSRSFTTRYVIAPGEIIQGVRPDRAKVYLSGLGTLTTTNYGDFNPGQVVGTADWRALLSAANEMNKVCNCVGNYYDTSENYCSCNY